MQLSGQLHSPVALHAERSPVPTELEAGLVPDAVCTMKVTIHTENGYRELTEEKSREN